MLDFELLRAFVAVADCGGFHRAAVLEKLIAYEAVHEIKGSPRAPCSYAAA
jgi:hypothetical protein